MINPFKILAAFCLVLASSGCTSTPAVTPHFDTSTPVVFTPTPVPATPRPSASPPPSSTPLPAFLQYLNIHTTMQCASVVSGALPNSDFSGILAVSTLDKDNESYIGLLNLENGEHKELLQKSEKSSYFTFVSPDGKKLAYNKWIPNYSNQSQLVILSLNGKFDKTIHWSKEWLSIAGWLDNDRLLFLENLTHTVDVMFTGDTLAVINPFAGSAKKIPATFPDLYNLNSISWENGIITLYNADLTRVVYPNLDGGLTLLDSTRGKIIQNISPVVQSQMPKWSPDGDEFVFSNVTTWNPPDFKGYDLFLVKQDGIIKKLTDFSDAPSDMFIDRYSWSPDGKSIALWIMIITGNEYDGYLNILDLQTGIVTNTCITTRYLESNAPVWSLDGEQLAFQVHPKNSSDNSPRNGQLMVLNLKENTAIQLNEYFRPIGWMNK